MQKLINRFKIRWCETFHRQYMWPFCGRVTCSRCLRSIPVQWEGR
jgi:hypothetical protein